MAGKPVVPDPMGDAGLDMRAKLTVVQWTVCLGL